MTVTVTNGDSDDAEDRFHRNESETERKREDDESDKAARRCTGDGGNTHRRPAENMYGS